MKKVIEERKEGRPRTEAKKENQEGIKIKKGQGTSRKKGTKEARSRKK